MRQAYQDLLKLKDIWEDRVGHFVRYKRGGGKPPYVATIEEVIMPGHFPSEVRPTFRNYDPRDTLSVVISTPSEVYVWIKTSEVKYLGEDYGLAAASILKKK